MSGTTGLSAAGWLFLVIAWGGIGALAAWCFYRLMKSGKG